MVATPYEGILVIEKLELIDEETGEVLVEGSVNTVQFKADDVVGNAVTFGDGGRSLQIASDGKYAIVDCVLSGGLNGDTHKLEPFFNSIPSGAILLNSINQPTTNDRQLKSAPIPVEGGTSISLIQRA